jgi:hypothetical protein
MFRKYYMPALLSVPGVLVVLTATLAMIATGTWAVLQVRSITATTAADASVSILHHHWMFISTGIVSSAVVSSATEYLPVIVRVLPQLLVSLVRWHDTSMLQTMSAQACV